MSTYRGHYLPVEARRKVLSIYRDRRAHGPGPWLREPMSPMSAMLETVKYFEGWLAEGAAFGPVGRTTMQEWVDRYRAACFYLDRMYAKPLAFKNTGRVSQGSDLAQLAG